MAGRSDGSIIIDTKLDNSGFGKGSKEMQSAVDSLHKQVDNLGKRVDSVMSGMGQAAQAASKQVNAMGGSARSASRDVDKLQESVNRAGAGKRINPIKFDQDAIRRAQKEMASLDKWGTGTNEKNLGARFTDLEKTLGRLSAKSAKLNISNPESVKAFRAEIDETEQTIRQMAADLLKVGNTKIPTAQFRRASLAAVRLPGCSSGRSTRRASLSRRCSSSITICSPPVRLIPRPCRTCRGSLTHTRSHSRRTSPSSTASAAPPVRHSALRAPKRVRAVYRVLRA